ncbi:MAG: phenylacetate--CoA ligase family protein [Armatimonadota bacterium]
MDLQSLYFRLPIRAQEWALSWYARRLDALYYGDSFPRWIEHYQETERWSAEELRQAQLMNLRYVLYHAFRHVPWFHSLAIMSGLRESHFESLDDLNKLPLMEKDPIRCQPWEFVRDDYPRKRLWQEKTSGTTGTSLRIFWPREMLPRWWALQELRVRNWAGVGQAMPRAMVGGRPVVPGRTRRPPYWRYNRRWRQLYLSSYHIAPATAGDYIRALQRYGSEWITGYGSAIALLGEYLIDHPAELNIRAAVTSGDTVTPRQRQAIEAGFGCRMFDNYGSAEACCLISACEHGRMHLSPEAGILEILDEQGEPCPPGVDGEFICTGLLNDAMPLIRYRTGDYGCWAVEQQCPCGRHLPIVEHITGRTDDYLELADGRRVGRISTAMKKAPSVRQAQLAQDSPAHAWLLVVPDTYYRDEDGLRLVDDVLSRIGGKAIDIEVRTVREIPRTPAGKHLLVRRLIGNTELQERYRALIRQGAEGEMPV